MMKYKCIALLIALLGFMFHLGNVYAEDVTPTPTPTPIIVQYDLAFPGILPDNFLYKLKVLRDKIQLAFIGDPKQKTAFLLKEADKGISAAAILVDKHNYPLAAQTALKAEHNMTEISQSLLEFNFRNFPSLMNQIKTASAKHQEVLKWLAARSPQKEQRVFAMVSEFSERNLRTIVGYEAEPATQ